MTMKTIVTDIENKLMVTKEGSREGNDIYTLLI